MSAAAMPRAVSPGSSNKALEGVAEMANALQVMTQRMCLRPGAHNQHIARVKPSIEPAIEHEPVNEPAQAQRNGHQTYREQNDSSRKCPPHAAGKGSPSAKGPQ